MSETTKLPDANADAILDAAGVPAHLRLGRPVWLVYCPGKQVKHPACAGTGTLTGADGSIVKCRCDGGTEWASWWEASGDSTIVRFVELAVGVNSGVGYKVHTQLLSLRYDFTPAEMFATKAEAQADADRRNGHG